MTVGAKNVIKSGDVFEIRVTVISATNGNAKVAVTAPFDHRDFSFSLIKSVLRAGRRVDRALAIGDRVKFTDDRGSSVGELVAIHDGRAGVKWLDSPDDYTWPRLSDLERAPAEVKGPDPQRGNPHNDY